MEQINVVGLPAAALAAGISVRRAGR